MIYFIGLLVGFLNGLFASGAGQVLVFYLIYILKKDTHISRSLSVSLLSISSIFALFGYFKLNFFDVKKIIFFVIISLIFGGFGTKIMGKISSNILNLISGTLIVVLTIYKIIGG
ncbi:MAG: sulfite exporter TauE/SafE family protein [Clostridia bacterium]